MEKSRLKDIWATFLMGIRDALQLRFLWNTLRTDDKIKEYLLKSVRLNICCFVGVNLVVYCVLLPLFTFIVVPEDEIQAIFVEIVYHIVSILFNFLFLVPVYMVTVILNSDIYQFIAERVEIQIQANQNDNNNNKTPVTLKAADVLFERLLVVAFLILTAPLYYIPWLGGPIYFCYCSWLYSFYCFGYKWNLRYPDWTLKHKVEYFEHHWLYFLGFGTPFTVLLWYFPLAVGLGLYSVLFPCFVAMAQRSKERRTNPFNDFVPLRLAIFYESLLGTEFILRKYEMWVQ